MENKKGFTLIELLVVIAILSLLIAISLIVMANYRDKAKDSRIKTVLVQIRNISTMISSETNSYESICLDGGINDANPISNNALKTIKTEINRINGADSSCFASASEYCVSTPLLAGIFFCVDNTGFSKEVSSSNCSNANKKCQ